MTTRERWIVYPLLFLTFGMTMRDKVWPQRHFMVTDMTAFGEITARKITCNELEVGRVNVQRLESVQSECRLMTLSAENGRDAIRLGAAPDGTGRLELLAPDGDLLVTLGGIEAGGLVTAIDRNEDVRIVLGHYDDQYGVFAESAKAGRRVPLTIPWRFENAPSDEVPAEQPTEEKKPVEEDEPSEEEEPVR